MDEPLFLKEYLKYVAENPDVKAHKQFKCSAWVGKDPFIVNATPLGTFYLYPELAAFLTTSKTKPGGFAAFASMIWQEEVKPMYYIAKWGHNPTSFLLDAAKTLYQHAGDKEAKFLNEALASPNSFFIPLNKIKSVKAESHLAKGSFIRIKASNKEFVLYNSARALRTLPKLIGGIVSQITGKWQEDVVSILAEAARKNARKNQKKR